MKCKIRIRVRVRIWKREERLKDDGVQDCKYRTSELASDWLVILSNEVRHSKYCDAVSLQQINR